MFSRFLNLPKKRVFYGYRIVAACSVIQAINIGGVFTFGVLFPELEREFGWSRAAIAGSSSVAFLIMGIGAAFMGRAGDKFGTRAVLTLAGIIFGIGFLLLNRMERLWELYIYYGLFVGLALSAHDVSTLPTIARWFVRRRGLMTGMVKTGAGLGQVLAPITFAALITGPGWRISCILFGVTSIVILVGAAQILRRNPAMLGLRPDGDTPETFAGIDQEEGGANFREALASKTLWILSIAKFCDLFCLFTVIVHIVPLGIDRGMSPGLAAGILSTIGGMSIVGRIFFGGVFDRFGARKSLLICFTILTGSLAILQFTETSMSLFLFALIYGPAHGGFWTITSPAVAEYFGTRSHGTIFGIVVCCGTFGATLGPIIGGGLFDAVGNYNGTCLLLVAFSFFGLLFASMLPRFRRECLGK